MKITFLSFKISKFYGGMEEDSPTPVHVGAWGARLWAPPPPPPIQNTLPAAVPDNSIGFC